MNKERSETPAVVMNELKEKLLPKKFGKWGKLWMVLLLVVFIIGLYNYIFRQLDEGLIVTAMRDYVSWGIYISNFVFFVAISLVGSLISAILKLSRAKWQTPLTRIAEIIAVAGIIFAGIIIVVDMGRPERFWHLFVYGRIQSPIIWDVIVIATYLVVSALLLYIPMIPDMAICRDTTPKTKKWLRKMYNMLSMGWNGSKKQHYIISKSVLRLSVVVIPLAFSIHTVTSWLFATTTRPGWDSTNFGAYFVSGAFVVGAASVICAMYVVRRFYGLQDFITLRHFNNMGRLLVMLTLVYLYFNVNEYFVPGYKMKHVDAEHLHSLLQGEYAVMFWAVQLFGMIIPVVIMMFKRGRRPRMMFILSVFVIVGAWFKRYLIVIPTLLHTNFPMQGVPDEYTHYFPTWPEWSITAASLAGMLLIITLFIRYFPILPIFEIAEEKGIPRAQIQ
jgi:molybdopterin-containing oxidoreductase family membrane subunit